MHQMNSKMWRLTNACVTVHGFSEGTAIFNIVGSKEIGNFASIWVSPEEMRNLGYALIGAANTICRVPGGENQ